jgi:hypothetical protein
MVVLNHMSQNPYLNLKVVLVGVERGPAHPLHGTNHPEPWAISSSGFGKAVKWYGHMSQRELW